MTSQFSTDPVAWLKSVIRNHIGSNITKYNWRLWIGQPKANMLGGNSYLSPSSGKVVDISPEFTLVKTKPSAFDVIATALLDREVSIGQTVALQFYQLRDFNGLNSDGSEDPVAPGQFRSMMLTGAKTLVPVMWNGRHHNRSELVIEKWPTIQNRYLIDLVKLLEEFPAAGGRNLVNVLVDANGEAPTFVDPPEAHSANEDYTQWPGLMCKTNSAKFTGTVAIRYNRGSDTYDVEFTPNTGEPTRLDWIHFDDMHNVLVDQLEDGGWANVKVQVLKQAPKKKPQQEALAA